MCPSWCVLQEPGGNWHERGSPLKSGRVEKGALCAGGLGGQRSGTDRMRS